jgi:hypothetical protein
MLSDMAHRRASARTKNDRHDLETGIPSPHSGCVVSFGMIDTLCPSCSVSPPSSVASSNCGANGSSSSGTTVIVAGDDDIEYSRSRTGRFDIVAPTATLNVGFKVDPPAAKEDMQTKEDGLSALLNGLETLDSSKHNGDCSSAPKLESDEKGPSRDGLKLLTFQSPRCIGTYIHIRIFICLYLNKYACASRSWTKGTIIALHFVLRN